MNVIELIEALSEFPEDAEVRLATQPAWPFEHSVGQPVFVYDGTVYIPEAAQLGYLSGSAKSELGW